MSYCQSKSMFGYQPAVDASITLISVPEKLPTVYVKNLEGN